MIAEERSTSSTMLLFVVDSLQHVRAEPFYCHFHTMKMGFRMAKFLDETIHGERCT